MKKIFKSALVLTCIAVVSGILIAVVNKFTFQPYSFSMTNEDKIALAAITDSTSFEVIDHSAISSNDSVRVVLRAANGSDKGNILIRAAGAGYQEGLIESFVNIGSNGAIKKAELVTYDAKNSYWNRMNTDAFYAAIVGKTSIDEYSKQKSIDGVVSTTAPFTYEGLFKSVKIALDYYKTNGSAIKSATATETISLGNVPAEDKMLTAIKTFYPTATSYQLLETFEATGYSIKVYSTNKAELAFAYGGKLSYEEDEGEPYDAEILIKVDNNGKVTEKAVYLEGMASYINNAINDLDGDVGATGSQSFIKKAIADTESFYKENISMLAGGIKHIFTLGTDKYLVIGEGTTVTDDPEHFSNYKFIISFVIDGAASSDTKLLHTEDYPDFMQNGIDGAVGATCSASGINAVINAAKTILGVQ